MRSKLYEKTTVKSAVPCSLYLAEAGIQCGGRNIVYDDSNFVSKCVGNKHEGQTKSIITVLFEMQSAALFVQKYSEFR